MRDTQCLTFMGMACLLCAMLPLSGLAAERQTERPAALREGPGTYYPVLRSVPRGATVATGAPDGTWIAAVLDGADGWLPQMVFNAPRGGIDYSGLFDGAGVGQVASVEVTAATKGALSVLCRKRNADPDAALALDTLQPDLALVRQLRAELRGRDADPILARLPRRPMDYDIFFGPEAETLLGRALAAHLMAPGMVNDAALHGYVNAVGALVGARCQRYDLPYRIAVFADDSVNGFGLPGGYILITRGLARQIRSEAELAFLIGHEIAHVSLYHGLREFKKREIHRRRDAAFAELDAATGHTKDAMELDLEEMADHAYLAIMGKRARADELEADLYGVAYAAAAGYDPHAAIDLLRRTDRYAGQDTFRHHPGIEERLAELRRLIAYHRLAWSGQAVGTERWNARGAATLTGSAP